MKKWLSMWLVLLICIGLLSSAFGESLDSALDRAFETGKISLVQAENPQPVPENCEIVLPPAEVLETMGFSGISMEETYALLRQTQLGMVSYSPDGTHGVGFLIIDESVLPVAVSPDRIAMIYPAKGRGVEDQYGVLERQYLRNFFTIKTYALFGMGDEGMIWSPSGRYCCTLNNGRAMVMGDLEYGSPIFIDTHTGEMFMADSFDTKFSSNEAGFWVSGYFSEDEQYFYAMYFGNRFENRCTFLRYDMATFSYEVLYGMEVNGRPALAQLKDESILSLGDRYISWTAQQLIKISPDGTVDSVSIDELMNITEKLDLYYKCLYYSPASGFALMLATSTDDPIGLLRLRPEDSLTEGLDTLWMICAQTMQPEAFSKEQLNKYFASDFDRYWADKDYLFIIDVKLSPEGRYAAVLAGAVRGRLHDDISTLLIVRLSDMKALPAEGIDVGKYISIAAARDRYLLNLSDEGILYLREGLFQVSPQ